MSEDAILSNHRETLSEAGSYSFTQNISIDNQQGGTELDEVWSVGTDTGETLVETEMRAGTTTSYTTEDGTTYSREQRDGETYYGVTATPENNVGLGGLSELNYTHRTEQVDGKTLHIYTSDDAESVPTGEQAGAEVTINDFNYRLEVFEGGHIKRLSIEFQATVTRDGSTQEVYSLTERRYFGIGNTTVEEPDWIEQAR